LSKFSVSLQNSEVWSSPPSLIPLFPPVLLAPFFLSISPSRLFHYPKIQLQGILRSNFVKWQLPQKREGNCILVPQRWTTPLACDVLQRCRMRHDDEAAAAAAAAAAARNKAINISSASKQAGDAAMRRWCDSAARGRSRAEPSLPCPARDEIHISRSGPAGVGWWPAGRLR